MDSEDELERIKRKKFRELMRKFYENKKEVINKPIEMNEKNFHEIIRDNPLVIVDFWAPWCGPCRMVSPMVESLARDYAGKIVFGKLNVDENRGISLMYNIMSIPTFLVFNDGKIIDRITGLISREALEQKIRSYLKSY